MRIGLVVLLAACDSTFTVPPDSTPPDELSGLTPGPHNEAGFQLEYGNDVTRAIAERSHTFVTGLVRSTAPPLASITIDDPSIVTIGQVSQDERGFKLQLTAPGAGDTNLVLRDATGAEIDHLTLHVRASDTLAIPRPWGAGPALVLAGEVERVHVTTMTNNVVTAGDGAVQFTLAGALSPATSDEAPYLFSEGDEVFFRAAASGTGSIVASAPDATTTVDVSLVSPAELTALSTNPTAVDVASGGQGTVAVGALAGSAPVYGAQCTWSAPQLTIKLQSLWGDFHEIDIQRGSIGDEPVFVYTISGPPGTFSATCTIGGLTTTIAVHIH